MTQEISFEISSDGGAKKALEELFGSGNGTQTIYIEKANGKLFPVANIERHPDCPKHIYEAWIKSLVQLNH